jgi:carbamoyl-phosphate synthase large subunit
LDEVFGRGLGTDYNIGEELRINCRNPAAARRSDGEGYQGGIRIAVKKTAVLVTGVGGRSIGHQILHALLLCSDRYRIVATDAKAFAFGLYQVDARYIVPLANSPDYISAVLQIIEREEIDVAIPGTQPELLALAENRHVLQEAGCVLIASPADVIRTCSDKWTIHRWLEANSIDVPQTCTVDGWPDLVNAVGFPIIAKPSLHTGGSRNVAILEDEEEVQDYLDRNNHMRDQVIFQEYVGTPDDEYTVGVLVSKTGDIIDSIVLRRNLVGLTLGVRRVIGGQPYALSTGYSQGFIIQHSLLQEACEALALKLGIRGPLNIQCRLSGNRMVVFEVHPRFSGTTSIRAEVGFNGPDVMIRNYLLDETFGRLDYQKDVAAIRAFRNIIVPIAEMNRVPRVHSDE